MIELSYKAIKPYIQEEEQQGEIMRCVFLVEEKEFVSEATIQEDENADAMTQMAKKSGLMRSMMLKVLKKAVGGNAAPKKGGGKEQNFLKKDKEAAVVRAFENIMDEVVYLETTGKWHLAAEFSEFERRIRQKPLKQLYDKQIMSRMLVEMARADGRIEEKERLFFDHFLNDETGRLSDLMRASYLTEKDCEKVGNKARATIFMIVAAVALTDNHFDEKEKEKLLKFAEMFGFELPKKIKLLKIAQDYTLEVAFKAKQNQMTEEELIVFAKKIGMEQKDAEKTWKRLVNAKG